MMPKILSLNQILLPVEISTGSKKYFFEKYGMAASFCTFSQPISIKTRLSRFLQSWELYPSEFFVSIFDDMFLDFHQLWRKQENRVLELLSWFKVQNEADAPYFPKNVILVPVEISNGNKFWTLWN